MLVWKIPVQVVEMENAGMESRWLCANTLASDTNAWGQLQVALSSLTQAIIHLWVGEMCSN